MEGKFGNQRHIGEASLFIPVACSEDQLLFSDIRYKMDNRDNQEGNFGLGVRTMLDEGIVGTYVYFDRRKSGFTDHYHSQATVGAEWLDENWEVRANGYIPLTDDVKISTGGVAGISDPYLSGSNMFVDETGQQSAREEILYGGDVEAGIKIPDTKFWLHAGAFSFNGNDSVSLDGIRTRVKYDLTENVALTAEGQYDDERGRQGWLGVKFTVPFGGPAQKPDGLKARMTASPVRDIDIVTQAKVETTGSNRTIAVVNAETGQAQRILYVDNTAAGGGDGTKDNPFNTLAAAQATLNDHDVVYINSGAGTTGMDNGFTINKRGVQVIGAGSTFVYDSSRFTVGSGINPNGTVLIAASAAPVLTNSNLNGDGVTVIADDVLLTGFTVDGAGRDGILADANAISIQNLGIYNVSTVNNNRMGIYLHGSNGGNLSAAIEKATMTGNDLHGIAIYDDTNGVFDVDLGGGGLSAGNNVLVANTFEDVAIDYDGRTLSAQNNWWGQTGGVYQAAPNMGDKPQIYYGAPVNDGLTSHWTYDQEWMNGTTIYDRSGNNYAATLAGGQTAADFISGRNGDALQFDGVNDAVRTNAQVDLTGTDALTISFWRRYDSYFNGTGMDFEITDNYNSSNYGVAMFMNAAPGDCGGGGAISVGGNGGANYGCYNRPATGNWVNITAVYNKGNTGLEHTLYFNGVQQTPTITVTNNNTGGFRPEVINMMSRGGASLFATGALDDVRVYNRALTSGEISELHRMDTSSAVDTANHRTTAP